MADVNLIPADRLARNRRKARVKTWLVTCGVYLLLSTLATLSAKVICSLTDPSKSGVESKSQSTEQSIQEYSSAIAQLQRRLARVTEELSIATTILRQPDWSKLLTVIADELGRDVVLNHCDLAVLNADGRQAADNPQAPLASSPVSPDISGSAKRLYMLRLSGFGRRQNSVSQFILRLERTRIFESVRLVNSYRQAFLSDQAVSFTIECRI